MTQVSTAFLAEPELLAELEKRAKPVAVGHDRVLFHEGDSPSGVFIIKKGAARLTSHSAGQAILDFRAGAGSLLGVPAAIGTKAYSLTAEALEGAELSLVSCEDFVNLMQTEPNLSFQVLRVLAEEIRFARETLADLRD